MDKLPIIKEMEGLTAKEMADILGITYDNCRMRLSKLKIKPISKDAIYSRDTVEKIRNVGPVGRPKKKPPEPVKSARKNRKSK
jgi:predicted ArsR family transcriptional regulator